MPRSAAITGTRRCRSEGIWRCRSYTSAATACCTIAQQTRYETSDDNYLTFFTLTQSCSAPSNSFYTCRWSPAHWVTHETSAEAHATRVVTIPTSGYGLLGFSRMNSSRYDVED